MDNLLSEAIRITVEKTMLYSNRMYAYRSTMEALLTHYAAFVESQTGKPAAETLAEIKAEAAKELAHITAEINATLLQSLPPLLLIPKLQPLPPARVNTRPQPDTLGYTL